MAELKLEDAYGDLQRVAGSSVTRSNESAINYMTIPQILAAKKILQEKLSNSKLDSTLKSKLTRLDAQYSKAQNSINKVYNQTLTDSQTSSDIKAVLSGKRDMLTLYNITTTAAKHDKIDKKDLFSYNGKDATIDFFKELNKSIPLAKVGLGVGVGLAGLGAISLIGGGTGAAAWTAFGKIGGFLAANPAFTALVASGAAIALAVKVVPAIYKAHKKVQENRMIMESVKADAYESSYKSQEEARKVQEKQDEAKRLKSEGLLPKDFENYEANKDLLISRLMADENLFESLKKDPKFKSNAVALMNLKRANLEAKRKNNEMNKEGRNLDKETKNDEREATIQNNVDNIVDAVLNGNKNKVEELLNNNKNLYERVISDPALNEADKKLVKEALDKINKAEKTAEEAKKAAEEEAKKAEEKAEEKAAGEEPAEKTTEEKSAEEAKKTAEDKKAEEKAAEEKAAGEEPAGEEPAEDKTAEDKTAEDKTAEDKTAETPTGETQTTTEEETKSSITVEDLCNKYKRVKNSTYFRDFYKNHKDEIDNVPGAKEALRKMLENKRNGKDWDKGLDFEN